MPDQVIIPASLLESAGITPPPAAPNADGTTPTPAAPPSVASEIAYLRQHGLEAEAGTLQAELEGLLGAQGTPPTQLQPAPITQTPPVVTPTPDAAKTAQEKALDPYAVDAPPGEQEDVQSVFLDDQGRARDAKTGKYVPVQALHRERDLHKQTRGELAATREKNARVEERLAILTEIMEAPTPGDAATPTPAAIESAPTLEDIVDPETDIFKFSKQMLEHSRKQDAYIKKLEEKVSGSDQMTRSQFDALQADQAIRSDVTSFYAKQPDFINAYNHLRTTRDAALQALGFADKGARDAQIASEEKALATNALKTKKSYAETLYSLAKAYGYALPAAVVPPPADPTPAVRQPGVDPASQAKIESIQNGKTASATLNGAGGSPAEGLTMEKLANMNEAEFMNLAGKLGKAKLDKLLRGS